MHVKNRVLWFALAISFGAHFLLYFWLHFVKQNPANFRQLRGVVSVDFVESVSHVAEIKPKSHSSKPSPPQKPQNSVQPQATQAWQAPPPDSNVTAGVAQKFLQQVTVLLGRNKIYPREAIDREQEGKVVVGITLDREGQVVAAQLEEPSHFQLLNEAALKTVRSVGFFPRVPDEVDAPIHLHVPLVYRIERN